MKSHAGFRIIAAGVLVVAIATIVSIKLAAQTGGSGSTSQAPAGTDNRLVVHEWGTFTAIAGKDGVALEWRPLNGPSDLPKFVHSLQGNGDGLRHRPLKGEMRTLLRMETPVVYFYSDNEMEVSVKVDFPQGKITEWYPHARDVNPGVNWGRIAVMPGAAVNLPVDQSESHYYPARETDAAPVRVCGTSGVEIQMEKFLFYRGVGNFTLPLSVKVSDDKVVLTNSGQYPISHLIVFENSNGQIGYRRYDDFGGLMTQGRPPLDQNLDSMLRELKEILLKSGLYEKEAAAMIKTWRSSWFEPGMRVFYILPRQRTDEVLPITIEPDPAELVRVLVGRVEVITPELERTVRRKVNLLGDPSSAVRERAMQEIRNYGRFSEPILKSLLESESDKLIRSRIQALLEVSANTN